FLEFRMVHPQSADLIKSGETEPGYEILRRKEPQRNGTERVEQVLVKKKPEMTGSSIKTANVVRGNLGEPEIHFTLNDEGTKRFADLTTEYSGRFMAIVLDGNLVSAPRISEPILTGSGRITGQFDDKEAF